MDFKEIQELIKLINKSNLTEFKMKDGDFSLSIRTKKYGKGRPQVIQQPHQQVVAPIAAAPVVQQPPVDQSNAPKANANQSASKQDSAASSEAAENDNLIDIKSPIVGTFYRSASPDKPPYLKVGDMVNVGDVVCIVEAMKLFNEIESEVSGKVVKVVIDDASPVEYDQVLFKVDPNG
ncbi:MAG: acetyl-CoA carboxylase biotin carboxyl carrier protein [Saprospiraceae bacterium]